MTDTMTPKVKKLVEQVKQSHEKWLIGTCDDAETAQERVMEEIPTLIAALEAAVERVGELERQNEVDRQLVSIVSADLMRTINGRDWMSEGRGPYKWNDDDYQREFGDACSEIRQSIALIKHVANSWDDCPREQEIWQACRAKAQELFEELRDRKALETKL